MKMLLFSIYDSKAERFTAPWTAETPEVAIRRFRHTVNQEGNDIAMFPEDYTLFAVGEYDQETGALTGYPTPHSLGLAVTYKQRPQLHEDSENA